MLEFVAILCGLAQGWFCKKNVSKQYTHLDNQVLIFKENMHTLKVLCSELRLIRMKLKKTIPKYDQRIKSLILQVEYLSLWQEKYYQFSERLLFRAHMLLRYIKLST